MGLKIPLKEPIRLTQWGWGNRDSAKISKEHEQIILSQKYPKQGIIYYFKPVQN